MKVLLLIGILVYLLFNFYDYSFVNGEWFIPLTVTLYVFLNLFYLWKYRKGQLLCFELFFAISYFLCSFLTPFVYPFLDTWSGRTFIDTDYNQMKVYGLSFIGYCAYLIALTQNKENEGCCQLTNELQFNKNSVLLSNVFCLFFIVLFYAFGGARLFTLYSNLTSDLTSRFEEWGEYMGYSMCAYSLSIVINFSYLTGVAITFRELIGKLPFLFYANTFLLVLPLVLSGLRSNAIQLLIPLLLMYSICIKRIKTRYVIGILLGGYCLLILIGLTRHGNSMIEQDALFLTLVKDFISANGANSYLVDYVDNSGIAWGSNMVLQFASIVPFLQSFILSFVSKSTFAANSSFIFTTAFMDRTQGGMGTGLIGDMYYSLGLVGIITLMFLLGYTIKWCSQSRRSLYAFPLLMVLSGNAIFAPRVEYCYILRSLSYTVIFLFIILTLANNKKNAYEHSLRNR